MATTKTSLTIRQKYELNPLKCSECFLLIPYKKRKKQGKLKFCNNNCSMIYYQKHGKYYSIETKRKMAIACSKAQAKVWDSDKKKKHSDIMKMVVKNNPSAYSTNNVCGRVKPIKIIDSYGNETKCLGNWELIVSEFLTKNDIKWTNKISEVFEYNWNNTIHRYFPDFKLPELNKYIEVKGFERERDREKWKQFPYDLIVLKLKEIKEIKNNTFSLEKFKGS